MYEIKNCDCFEYLETLKNKSIDLFLLDLPYGQTSCKWDVKIDLDKMWKLIKQKMKAKTIICFFTTTKFGIEIINSNPKWFRYDLVWEKYNSVGFMSVNKMPLRKHEMIYIFSNMEDDVNREYNIENRKYAEIYHNFLKSKNIKNKDIKEYIKCEGFSHFFGYKSSQFSLPTEENYNIISKHYNIDKEHFYKTYDELLKNKESLNLIYNPQKTKGKPYKAKENLYKNNKIDIYGNKGRIYHENKGDRHPTSIIKFKHDKDKLHRTQKPTLLLEWLIKTYTNENMNVCDFTMGSGSTCIACLNTNRNFYGCELDKEIFETAKKRIEKHNNKDNN